MGLPVLGAKPGAMAADRFADLPARVLHAASLFFLKRIRVIAPLEDHGRIADALQLPPI
jgi:hypothetical protein